LVFGRKARDEAREGQSRTRDIRAGDGAEQPVGPLDPLEDEQVLELLQ
jgi:hypothetical protein